MGKKLDEYPGDVGRDRCHRQVKRLAGCGNEPLLSEGLRTSVLPTVLCKFSPSLLKLISYGDITKQRLYSTHMGPSLLHCHMLGVSSSLAYSERFCSLESRSEW